MSTCKCVSAIRVVYLCMHPYQQYVYNIYECCAMHMYYVFVVCFSVLCVQCVCFLCICCMFTVYIFSLSHNSVTGHALQNYMFWGFCLIFKVYYFRYQGCFAASMSGHHVHAWGPWRQEESDRYFGTGIYNMDNHELLCWCWK